VISCTGLHVIRTHYAHVEAVPTLAAVFEHKTPIVSICVSPPDVMDRTYGDVGSEDLFCIDCMA
jgi:hypothetical protein